MRLPKKRRGQNGMHKMILLAAGVCQGSFGLGYKDYRPFPWALFWLIYNLLCLAVAGIWAFVQIPGLAGVYGAHGREVLVIFICGLLWGASAVCFTKGVDLLGMALLYGISMGISIIGGSLLPLFLSPAMLGAAHKMELGAGLALSAAGILLVTAGGKIRDARQKTGNSRQGMILAVFSGLGSALMNLGFEYGKGMGAQLQTMMVSEAGISAASWFLVILGGNLAAAVYCVPQLRRKEMADILQRERRASAGRILKLILTALVWYSALCLYGIYSSLAGEYGSVTGWVIFNALALIVSNLWGIVMGEWKGAGRGLGYVLAGNAVMIAAWIFLARV